MLARSMLLCAGFALFANAVNAQEYVTKAEYLAGQARTEAALEKLSSQLAALSGNATESPATIEERVKVLETNQKLLVKAQHDHGVALGQIAARDEAGNYHWQFNANSQPAREEFKQALRKTTPNYGSLVVHNRMASGQWIKVNGSQRYIKAGGEEVFDVKPGTATTQITGQQPMSWLIGLPDYIQEIDIKPGNEWPIAQRIVYDWPVYVDGWQAVSAY